MRQVTINEVQKQIRMEGELISKCTDEMKYEMLRERPCHRIRHRPLGPAPAEATELTVESQRHKTRWARNAALQEPWGRKPWPEASMGRGSHQGDVRTGHRAAVWAGGWQAFQGRAQLSNISGHSHSFICIQPASGENIRCCSRC